MTFLIPFIASFLISVVLTPLTIIFAKKFGFVDNPKVHKHPAIVHTKTVPRAGGIAVFAAVFLCVLLFFNPAKELFGILLAGLILVIIGVVDDKYELNSWLKLALQALAALIVVLSGVGISFITDPTGGVIRLDTWRVVFDFFGRHSIVVFADLFALFWIVWVINMVNFSTGVDGQMPGIVFVSLMVIFAATLRFIPTDPNQLVVSQLALVGAGATLGFLIFNFFPAKIFPGDSGSYFLGFLVAVVAILSGAKVGTAILVMAVPLIDGVFTIFRRIAEGKSPFMGDRKHLHHRLLELGWGQRRIALFYWLLCAILGSIALFLPSVQKLFAGVVVAVIILGGLVWLNMNLPQKDQG
ncbi:MAG TPA: MraY family glycosyltransferase [Candidatus Saccharimonadales bacterium]|nr:MraY family glycosyltransferase [Candidatus Saccharimonadales bacterium]